MAQVNQIIAVANGKKSRAQSGLGEIHHKLQHHELLTGISRTYQPRDDDGEKLPSESKRVQYRVIDAITDATAIMGGVFDIVGTLDLANCTANADVVVDGDTILANVPVTHLLFLEKQLVDLHTFVSKLPTLDPAFKWVWNRESDTYSTEPVTTVRTKKVVRNHVLSEATKEHPAQVQTYHEDMVIGDWTKTDFSGAIPESSRKHMVNRVRQLQDAVKFAREKANSAEVVDLRTGKPVFEFIFGDTAS